MAQIFLPPLNEKNYKYMLVQHMRYSEMLYDDSQFLMLYAERNVQRELFQYVGRRKSSVLD